MEILFIEYSEGNLISNDYQGPKIAVISDISEGATHKIFRIYLAKIYSNIEPNANIQNNTAMSLMKLLQRFFMNLCEVN
jgi:hypothetical protein